MGKRRTQIKKLESKSKLHVTFSKRKLGIFRKAAELSLLCNCETAVVVFSQNGKIFSSGHPDPDSVFRRYLSGASSDPSVRESTTATPVRRKYEDAMKELEEEREKTLDAMVDVLGSGYGDGFWWNRPVEEMDLEDVLRFKKCVEELKRNLVAAAEKKTTVISTPPPPPPPPPATLTVTEFSYLSSLLNGDLIENGGSFF